MNKLKLNLPYCHEKISGRAKFEQVFCIKLPAYGESEL